MKSEIHFLNELDEDLAEAAWRESLKGRRPRRSRAVRRRPHRRWVVALAGAVAFLTLAGGVGWFAMRGQGGAGVEARTASLQHRARGIPTAAPAAAGAGASSEQPALYRAPDMTKAADEQEAPSTWSGTQAAGLAQGDTLASLPSIQIAGDMTRIVKTGRLSIVLTAGTFDDRFREAGTIAARYRGYVQSSSTSGGRSGTLTIRVPAARFEAAMSALAALGTRVESQSVTGENVTSRFVDLNARLSVWQQQLQVLRGLLGKAPSPEATIRYTNLIMDVQFRIEEIKGELRVLRNQTSMATIKASLHEAGAPIPERQKVTKPNLGKALQHAIAGFLGVVYAVTVGLGYLIPISALIAIAGFVFVRIRRRRAVA
jgi:hypothetical protein